MMERDHHHQTPNKHQDNPPSLSRTQNPKETDSPRNVAATANDRLKRDEWSEGAVSCLLEAYEAKWTLRNRAKLKGQDWEDVAKHVSMRGTGAKSAKTQTQCKNKIESMKKRYRSESAAAADASSWPLYPRLDLLLRGNGIGTTVAPAAAAVVSNLSPPPSVVVEDLPSLQAIPLPPPPPPPPPPPAAALEVGSGAQNSHGSNGVDRVGKEEGEGGVNGEKVRNHEESKKIPIDDTESNSSTGTAPMAMEYPKWKRKNENERKGDKRKEIKSRKREYWEIGESIRWMAEVVVRSEQARMETIREIERMRAEAEAKRGEMDLKRTEIIANTQLQTAKLFAGSGSTSTQQFKKNPAT